MSRVHFIGGEKGGVGKSFTARLLAQYLIDSGKPFVGFDTDQSHGTFSRFYGEYISPIDIQKDSSLDQIIEACVDYPEHEVIIDLAAQSSRRLEQWIQEGDVFSLFSEVGIPVYFWHVMDDGADSNALLDRLLDRYQKERIRIVVVQNLGRGEHFERFQQSGVYRKAQSRNVHFVTLKCLQAELTQKIDFNNTSFWAAANSLDGMSLIEKQRVKVWLRDSYDQLREILADEAIIAE